MSATASRAQHLAPALAVLVRRRHRHLGSASRGEPAGAYLFPRLISGVMVALALWNARARRARARVRVEPRNLDAGTLRTDRCPGSSVMLLAYALFAAKRARLLRGLVPRVRRAVLAVRPAPRTRAGSSSWARRFGIAFAVHVRDPRAVRAGCSRCRRPAGCSSDPPGGTAPSAPPSPVRFAHDHRRDRLDATDVT